jgi:hypothetical protein
MFFFNIELFSVFCVALTLFLKIILKMCNIDDSNSNSEDSINYDLAAFGGYCILCRHAAAMDTRGLVFNPHFPVKELNG